MKAAICDKCGRIFPAGDGSYHTVEVDKSPMCAPGFNNVFHMCDDCLDAFMEWIQQEDE